MAPKRKATDAASASSPLKKRNAVTAGIGRAAESESNGIGFSYYGRTDDREDVRKNRSPALWSSALFCRACPHPMVDNLLTLQSDPMFEAEYASLALTIMANLM